MSVRSRISSAPTPEGPPNLCALMAIMSAWGRGSFPADCEQSAKTRPPCFRTTALKPSKGWITPVSLFTGCIATNESATSKGRRTPPPLVDAQPLRILRHAHYGVMLDCRGHNPPRFCSRESDGNGFACAAGENYMVMPAQRCSNPGPSVLECGTCRPAIGMRRRGIGPAFKCAQHCFPSLRQYGRGGGMIEIKTTGQGGVTHLLRNRIEFLYRS